MKNNRSVLLITVRADFGGGPKHIDVLLSKISYPVYIACPRDDPYYAIWKQHPKVMGIIVIPHRKFTAQALLKIAAACYRYNIKLVHSHGKGAGIYSRTLKLLRPSIKVIHTYHGITASKRGIQRLVYFGIEKILSPLTNQFISVSHGERDYCIGIGILPPAKSSVIHNGIEPLERVPNASIGEGAEHTFVVATLTRFDYAKNMQEAFAIAECLRKVPQIKFLWIGDGEDKDALEKRALANGLTNIIFVGFQKDIASMLSKADAYLSTSRHEGLPFALLEAFSLGLPVVASDVVGNNEVVEHHKNGFLYELGKPEQAAEYLLQLIRNKEQYQAFSAQAYHAFLTKFSATKMVREIERFYQSEA